MSKQAKQEIIHDILNWDWQQDHNSHAARELRERYENELTDEEQLEVSQIHDEVAPHPDWHIIY